MAIKAPGLYARIDVRAWADERLLSLTKEACCGYFRLTTWSKDQGRDGIVTKNGLRLCDVTDGERDELVTAGILVPEGQAWRLSDFGTWQMLVGEQEEQKAVRSNAGKASGASRRAKRDAERQATSAATSGVPKSAPGPIVQPPSATAYSLAQEIDRVWPAPTDNKRPEGVEKIAQALAEAGSQHWDYIVDELNRLLTAYHKSPSAPNARKYLATAGYKIRNMFIPDREAA